MKQRNRKLACLCITAAFLTVAGAMQTGAQEAEKQNLSLESVTIHSREAEPVTEAEEAERTMQRAALQTPVTEAEASAGTGQEALAKADQTQRQSASDGEQESSDESGTKKKQKKKKTSSKKSKQKQKKKKASAKKRKTKKKKLLKQQKAAKKEKKKAKQQARSTAKGMGAKIARYALRFVGNPYVYGGTSLTHGADCSGFVMSVYRHFGISLPRTSGEQGRYGKNAGGLSNAKPGDLISYSGHIGIYIGNGQIVHASTEKTGIKVSNASYRPILSVRRIV